MTLPLTQRQVQWLRKLPPGYNSRGAQKGSPVVRRSDGKGPVVQPNGRRAALALVERVQSYLHLEGG